MLWPANHRLVPTTVTVTTADELSDVAGFGLVAVSASQGEPGTDLQGVVLGSPDTAGYLRPERLGAAGDRIYVLTYRATDRAGDTADCTAAATVPHDRRP